MINTPNISIPKKFKAGDVIEIKALIPHKMAPASGDKDKRLPAKFIEVFTASYNNQTIFEARLTPQISANPYLSFFLKVNGPGTLILTWQENDGQVIQRSEIKLKVPG